MANRLIKESSPYLLQHAENPVDWYPWGEEALNKARKENKLIIVSIGYSACHWCHVMEHECFEEEDVAAIMNEHFVCIKVDREERPDVDQVYMLAVQLMTGQGGWPLNCICLPDQRPVYGGTYFRKNDWMNLLSQLANFWHERPEEARAYAERLTAGVAQSSGFDMVAREVNYHASVLDEMIKGWKKLFDAENGGYKGAPKFPMFNNWQFLLRYAYLNKDDAVMNQVRLSLDKILAGGIYDHVGGGISRYSTDGTWHIPHFEKMLYDNAQLLSLYAEAWLAFGDDNYRQAVYHTVEWLKREMTSPLAGFYSALDADSEGVEGKFYVFNAEELRELLDPAELKDFVSFYGITDDGNWKEEHTNVLFARADRIWPDTDALISAREKVFSYRNRRVHPGLDNKILCSWNAMALKGLCDAYRAFGDQDFLNLALNNAYFLKDNLIADDNSLWRTFKGAESQGSAISGFLDDYALLIDAFVALYEVTFSEEWLYAADGICGYVLQHFYDAGTGLFFYTSQSDIALIVRKHEVHDNVIPSSNSVMANNLFKLGHFLHKDEYLEQADIMLESVYEEMLNYGREYSNWANLLLNRVFGVHEIAIAGMEAEQKRMAMEKYFIPNKIILGGSSGSLPLLRDKVGNVDTKIYVCKNRSCALPVTEADEAFKQIVN